VEEKKTDRKKGKDKKQTSSEGGPFYPAKLREIHLKNAKKPSIKLFHGKGGETRELGAVRNRKSESHEK